MAVLWTVVEVAPRAAVLSAAATVVSLVPEDEGAAEVAMRGRAREPVQHGEAVPALPGEPKVLSAATVGKRVPAGVRTDSLLARRKANVKPLPREADDKLVPPCGAARPWRRADASTPDVIFPPSGGGDAS